MPRSLSRGNRMPKLRITCALIWLPSSTTMPKGPTSWLSCRKRFSSSCDPWKVFIRLSSCALVGDIETVDLRVRKVGFPHAQRCAAELRIRFAADAYLEYPQALAPQHPKVALVVLGVPMGAPLVGAEIECELRKIPAPARTRIAVARHACAPFRRDSAEVAQQPPEQAHLIYLRPAYRPRGRRPSSLRTATDGRGRACRGPRSRRETPSPAPLRR